MRAEDCELAERTPKMGHARGGSQVKPSLRGDSCYADRFPYVDTVRGDWHCTLN